MMTQTVTLLPVLIPRRYLLAAISCLWLGSLTSGIAQDLVVPALRQGARLEGELNEVNALLFTETPPLLVTAGRRRGGAAIYVWNLTTGNLLRSLETEASQVYDLAYSEARGQLASAGHDGYVRLWNVTQGSLEQTLGEGNQRMTAVAFSPNGQFLANSQRDGTIFLWDLDSGGLVHTLEGHTDTVRALAFTPDGNTLASVSGGDRGGGDTTLRLWDVVGGDLLETYEDSERTLTSLAISSDGSTIVAGNVSGQVFIWQLAFGVSELIRTVSAHDTRIGDLKITPDNQLIVTASDDETLKLLDAASGTVVLTLPFSDQVRALAFDQAGRVLAAGGQTSTVQLWERPEASP